MKPSKGRIVWYWSQKPAPGGGVEFNAIPCMVTDVYQEESETVVDLTGFEPGQDPCFFKAVRESFQGTKEYGRWSWPPRVEG